MKITEKEIGQKLDSLKFDEDLHTALIVAESRDNNSVIITIAGDCSPIVKALMSADMILDSLGESKDEKEFYAMLELYADIIALQSSEKAEKLGNLILEAVEKSRKEKIRLF